MDLFNKKQDDGLHRHDGGPGGQKKEGGPSLFNNIVGTLLIFVLIIFLYSYIVDQQIQTELIPFSVLAHDVQQGNVASITVKGEDLEISYTDGIKKRSKKEVSTAISDTLVNYGTTPQQLRAVSIDIKNPSGAGFWFLNLAPIFIPILLVVFIVWVFSRQVRGAGMQAFSFGQSKARFIDPNDTTQRVLFADVAGVKEAKEELQEIVDFLKHPKKFLDIGARIPKGVLLMGAPGTGKTLLARAVAGEAGVPFFSISGSEFVEMFVGVGASRVRDLFKMAKRAAPAIIFIDEIDAVGRVRGTGIGGGNDEREQTLNQILVEMDGFEPTEKVIVMAASNRPDVLDPALLRPGRFDRRVALDLPDREDREAILKIHARKKPLAEDVNIRVVAERTPGFSGADLYSLMNEGAILAARENRKKVSQFDLIRSIEKVMLGPERKSHLLSKKEKEITAYHEAGHALVSSILPHADPVHKVTIISRAHAGGYTLKLPLEERRLQSKKEFLDDIAVAMGGYVAEMALFDDITTGPSNDLAVATGLARNMVTRYGMSEHLGPMTFEDSAKVSRGGMGEREYSEELFAQVDKEVAKILNDAKHIAEKIIIKHRDILDAIAQKLITVETLERKEFEELLVLYGIEPKRLAEEIHPDPTAVAA